MGTVLFRMSDYQQANFGWPCGGTFIPNRAKCWTDPKTGRRLKTPINYQVYQKIVGSKGKAAQTLYRDREQAIRDRRRAAVPGWKKQTKELDDKAFRTSEAIKSIREGGDDRYVANFISLFGDKERMHQEDISAFLKNEKKWSDAGVEQALKISEDIHDLRNYRKNVFLENIKPSDYRESSNRRHELSSVDQKVNELSTSLVNIVSAKGIVSPKIGKKDLPALNLDGNYKDTLQPPSTQINSAGIAVDHKKDRRYRDIPNADIEKAIAQDRKRADKLSVQGMDQMAYNGKRSTRKAVAGHGAWMLYNSANDNEEYLKLRNKAKLEQEKKDKPALNLDGNYKDTPPKPKESGKKLIIAKDLKSAADREAYATQELAEAKKSGDQSRIKSWEEQAKKARMAKLKADQQSQKTTQTSLFNPLAYDKDINESPLLSKLYQLQSKQVTPGRIDKANAAISRQFQKLNQQQAALRAEVARAKKVGDEAARKKASTALAPLHTREAALARRSNRIRRLDPRLSENSQSLKHRADFTVSGTTGTVLFRMPSNAEFGWKCGDTFIPNNRKCYTDPKTGIRLKTPLTFKEYTRQRAQVYRDAQRGQLPQNDYDRSLLQSVSDRQVKLKTQKEKLQLTQAAASVGARQVLPSGIAEVEVAKLKVDPKRFQYKILGAQTSTGSVGSLSGVRTWDANLAGIIQVWQDPKDKQVYVVNGHNRTERAKALGVQKITAKFIKAKTPEEARAIGALTNISESKGTSLDAAKFFRDSGVSREDLERKGIPMREKIATDGLALSRLSEPLFNRVVQGSLPEQRAVTIGQALKDHKQQQELVDLIEKEEKRGKKINNDTIAELTDMVVDAPKVQQSQGGLFDLLGFTPETRSLAVEKAQLQAGIKRQLSREKKLFGTVGKSRAAEDLAKAGNQINVEQSAEISETASKALDAFDKEKNLSGATSTAINRAAERIANDENPKKVEKETYDEILADLQKTYKFGEGSGSRVAKRRIGDNRLAASRHHGQTAEFGAGLKRRLKRRKRQCCCAK